MILSFFLYRVYLKTRRSYVCYGGLVICRDSKEVLSHLISYELREDFLSLNCHFLVSLLCFLVCGKATGDHSFLLAFRECKRMESGNSLVYYRIVGDCSGKVLRGRASFRMATSVRGQGRDLLAMSRVLLMWLVPRYWYW